MPKKPTRERVAGRYFTWVLFARDGVWYADGRSNTPPAGRHSLGVRDRAAAVDRVHHLDTVRAVDLGLADRAELHPAPAAALPLDDGWALYRVHASRPRVTGGAKPKSIARYKAVFDKFLPFARGQGVAAWDRVTAGLLQQYAAWLDGEGYAYRTEYLELTTIKQCANWLRKAGHLPDGPPITLALHKPSGTDTYCWRPAEVAAMAAHARADPDLVWLADVIVALAATGLRISELAGLRVTDVDRGANVIRLTDETATAPGKAGATRRQTKNSRGRSFPISGELAAVLDGLPAAADGLVFHGPRGGRLKPDTLRTILVRDVLTPLAPRFPSTPGTPGFRDGRLHSFRHYFCSRCATSGVSELTVMTWLGHQASGMVKHYFHLHDEQAQEQMGRVTFVPGAGGTVPPAGSEAGGGGNRRADRTVRDDGVGRLD